MARGIFGGDDDEDERSGGSSFLGGIGSAIWTAVKWVAIAAAAVIGIPALFKNFDGLRNTVDEWTGGRGTGLGSKLAGVSDRQKEIYDDYKAKASNDTETEKNNKDKATKFSVTSSALDKLKFTKLSGQDIEQLSNVEQTRKNAYDLSTPEDRSQALDNLNFGQKAIFNAARTIERINSDSIAYNSARAEGAPEFNQIPLDLKSINIPQKLDSLGAELLKADWRNKSTLDKVEFLHSQLKDNGKLIETPSELNKNYADGLIDKLVTSDPDMSKINKYLHPSLLNDVQLDQVAKSEIKDFIAGKKYNQALDKIEAFSKHLEENGKKYTNSDKGTQDDEKARYAQVIKDYVVIKKHVQALQSQSEFDGVLSDFNSKVIATSRAAATNIEQSREADHGIPTEAEKRARAAADKARTEGAGTPPVPEAGASVPAQSTPLVPPADRASAPAR